MVNILDNFSIRTKNVMKYSATFLISSPFRLLDLKTSLTMLLEQQKGTEQEESKETIISSEVIAQNFC